MRITVDFVLKLLGDAYTAEDIVRHYPELENKTYTRLRSMAPGWLARKPSRLRETNRRQERIQKRSAADHLAACEVGPCCIKELLHALMSQRWRPLQSGGLSPGTLAALCQTGPAKRCYTISRWDSNMSRPAVEQWRRG
jgi:hypothetical protein